MKHDTSTSRFWSYVQKTESCWIWSGYKKRGYGALKIDGKFIAAHRLSFYLHNGYMPNICMHTCDNPPCVNPEHLVDGTPQENRLDCVRKNRHNPSHRFKNVTHCLHGHEYTEKNTYLWKMPNGNHARLCRTCNRRRMRDYRAKKANIRRRLESLKNEENS